MQATDKCPGCRRFSVVEFIGGVCPSCGYAIERIRHERERRASSDVPTYRTGDGAAVGTNDQNKGR